MPCPRQLISELAGPWQVKIKDLYGAALLSFTVEVAASCNLADTSIATMTTAPFYYNRRTEDDYIWAQFANVQDAFKVKATPSGFTNADCRALATQHLQEARFLVEIDPEGDIASSFILTDGDPATISVRSPFKDATSKRLAAHHQEQLMVTVLEKRGGLFLLRLRAPLKIGHSPSPTNFLS